MRSCKKTCYDIAQYERLLEPLEYDSDDACHDKNKGKVGYKAFHVWVRKEGINHVAPLIGRCDMVKILMCLSLRCKLNNLHNELRSLLH